MKAMETIHDLIEEAKVRTVWWGLLVFAVTYFITNTSKSIWMNIPISILLVAVLRIISNEVDIRWKTKVERRSRTYVSHLEKKQLPLDDPCIATVRPPLKWKRKIDSPVVEAAIDEFINKILQDFVIDLWYSEITPDREAPELIHEVIMDALAEISERVKRLNLVDLMTRDIVDLFGDHIDQFRRTQAAIGMDVMGILSSEERDERLKYQLMASNELHPALVSAECEYKVLQRLVGGILAIVLRPREAQCPLVRCISREFVTCLVVQPILDFASPEFINELIECIILALKEEWSLDAVSGKVKGPDAKKGEKQCDGQKSWPSTNADAAVNTTKVDSHVNNSSRGAAYSNVLQQSPPIGWAQGLEAATQRRTEVLTPENLENMWTKGRHYDKKLQKNEKVKKGQEYLAKSSEVNISAGKINISKDKPVSHHHNLNVDSIGIIGDLGGRQSIEDVQTAYKIEPRDVNIIGEKTRLKRSNSTSALDEKFDAHDRKEGLFISENFYGPNLVRRGELIKPLSSSEIVIHNDRPHPPSPKLRCRVLGAYFEKSGSKSFAVYSVAVTEAENATWFVKRRYRNFERLHRHLKDIPNYTLHLPPKRIFSSSTEDNFVHQRCIQLDKYLQDLLSIANVAEQHEVWDFLSASSKNYSFGKSSSVMRTLAVNVDDAMDDIVHQFKGTSDGIISKITGSPQHTHQSPSVPGRNLSWNSDLDKHVMKHDLTGSTNSFSDNEEDDHVAIREQVEKDAAARANGWHSDNELNSKEFPPRVVKRDELGRSFDSDKNSSISRSEFPSERSLGTSFSAPSCQYEELYGMPAEWAPPNVTVPVLNLVDKIFQLKKRGWLRRQVFWMSKQILHLMMEDAVDDWLLRQVHWLRREDVIAQGIRWVQDVLWPGGTFFKQISVFATHVEDGDTDKKTVLTPRMARNKSLNTEFFDQHLEAARRANEIKKLLFDGAPSALVGLVGPKQYKRCANDIYYFSQSRICIKQLAYGGLELLIISVFPELRDLVLDIHKQNRGKIVA